ncbi:MAG: hypothetical protein D6715_08285 [Calditrichaeota bacterium]|nr:MAG: hypothetical protein D6715_08285 [Calditrichota bacterium]
MGYVHEALKKAQQNRNGGDEFAVISERIQAQVSRSPVQRLQTRKEILRDYYLIKERLHSLQMLQGVRFFTFTSAHRAEGVTTVVAHVGYIWANSLLTPGFSSLTGPEARILLVDANLNNPQLNAFFNLENEMGLAECLTQRLPAEKAIKQTSVKNLFVLTAGTLRGDLSHQLSGSAFANLLQELQLNFGAVLVDAPPVIAHPELIALSTHLKHFILVVRSEDTPSYAVKKSIETLSELGRKPLGIVLNARRYYIPEKIYRRL